MKIPPRLIAYITLLVYWAPSNGLWYLWSFILFFFIILAKPEWTRFKGKNSKNIFLSVCIFLLFFFLSSAINFHKHESNINNLVWSIISYGSSFFILLIFLMIPFGEEDIWKIFKFSLCVSLIQVFVGYYQMIEYNSFKSLNPFAMGGGAGDLFVGTTLDPGIGNQVAVKLGLVTLLFIPFWFQKRNMKNTIILTVLCLGWILTSAIYTLLLGLLVIGYHFIFKPILFSFSSLRLSKSVFYATILGIISMFAFFLIQPENISYISGTLSQAYSTLTENELQSTGRKVAFYRKTLIELPAEYPSTLLIGTGPGNYSSRSAWLVSGEYLAHQPWYIPVTPTPLAKEYTMSLWSNKLITEEYVDAGSLANQPFSSWFSVFAEVGILGLIPFAAIFYYLHKSLKNSLIHPSSEVRLAATGIMMSLHFVLLLFLVDNLFEWPLVMGQFFLFACILLQIPNQSNK
jgi:hypothetical protein